jgi:hypothetical protein
VIYVLSGSRRETARWAQSQGHSLRHARHVYSAETLPGRIAGVQFVQLPGFETRRDRHAIVTRLKRANYRNIPVERWIEHQDDFGGWERHPGDLVAVEIVADATPALEVIEEAQAAVDELAAETAETAFRLDAVLTPPGEQPVISDEADPIEQFLNLTEKEPDEQPTEVTEVKAHEVVEVVQPVEAEQLEESKPKRTRRTKQQMAYDAALADWESNGGSLEAVIEARDALAKRHPEDERLLTAPQSDAEVEAQAEDDDALDF